MRSRWPGRIVLLLACAGVLAALQHAFRPVPVEIDVAEVTRGSVRVTVDEEGRTRIRERFVVASPLVGRLRRIGLHAGDVVRRGATVLAVVEPSMEQFLDVRERRRIEAQIDVARAALDRTTAAIDRAGLAHDHAGRELERMRKLKATGAVAAIEFDAAEQTERLAAEDLRAARHAQRVAQFELALAESVLAVASPENGRPRETRPFEIRAPIDGTVLRVLQESEATIPVGATLLEVGDPADLEVVVEVLTRDAVRIAPGAPAELVQWGGGRALDARVRLIEPAAFTKVSALGVEEQRVLAVLDLLDPPATWSRLGDAYRVEAQILVDEARDACVVPAGALFRAGASWAAYRLRGETVELQKVTTGRTDGRTTEVVSGLDEGDRVVLHPGADVVPGVLVTVRRAGPP